MGFPFCLARLVMLDPLSSVLILLLYGSIEFSSGCVIERVYSFCFAVAELASLKAQLQEARDEKGKNRLFRCLFAITFSSPHFYPSSPHSSLSHPLHS